jgi:hypothetical protein
VRSIRAKWEKRRGGASSSVPSAGALDDAEALVGAGRRLDAVVSLTAANRVRHDPAIERRLVELRHEAFAELDRASGSASWPPFAADMFPGAEGLPEITPRELRAETVRSGVVSHGGIVVRGLISQARVRALIDDIDRTFDAYEAFHNRNAPASETAPWYVPFNPSGGGLGQVRPWVWGGGGVLTVDSPRSMFDVLEVFEEAGLREPIAGYLGERPALSAKKWTLRRVPLSSGTNWHQDGAFLGNGIHTVNVWLTLTHCGDDAPGLDVVPARMPEILPTGTEGAIFDWSVGEPVVARVAEHAPVQRPVFEPGDAMLFDDYFLHRTAVGDRMCNERYAIESWFFAPSTYPLDQIPIAV